MPLRVVITDPAMDDLVDGHAFYEEREPGAGDYFLNSVYRDIDTLAHSGGMHPKPHRRHYRMICSRHPFGVFYNVIDETVEVIAVVDLRRNPKRILKLLRQR
ncbi:MAG: type II toxin-antitoxin system RelE/ParE family toxin [Roseimicrobium sp.]